MRRAGRCFHALNRAAGRARVFSRAGAYLAFEKALAETDARMSVSVLTCYLMAPGARVARVAPDWLKSTLRPRAARGSDTSISRP